MNHRNPTGTVVLYASVGSVLTRYGVNVEAAELVKGEAVTMPENVQYAWPHASGRYLYVATSNSASGLGPVGDRHHISALAIDALSGALTPHGEAIPLPTRPIHITTDIPSRNVLAAFSNPGALRIYRINADATLGSEVPQPDAVDPGIYPHQVRVSLDDRRVILIARGHDAADGKPEQPGALKVFGYSEGVLQNATSVAPNGGFGFGPRHLDFHPTRPWVYVSLERQNQLAMFSMADGNLSNAPLFSKSTLGSIQTNQGRQMAGTVHVHPNGKVVYAVNRASSTTVHAGTEVFAGGENTFAVYALDQSSGEPNLIQHIDTGGIHCRTFHIDPSGKLLVAAHIVSLPVKTDAGLRDVPANLSLFRIAADGRLSFVRSYDVDVGDKTMFWMGMVTL
jgi:6-phosphogluconolactonase